MDDQDKALRFSTDVLGFMKATSFAVDDVNAEYERLRGLGVRFTQEPLRWIRHGCGGRRDRDPSPTGDER